MAFDAAAFLEHRVADPTALYRQRRESAAALWETGTSQPFNIRKWVCGTAVCAIGDLAVRGHDGWSWSGSTPEHSDKSGFYAISDYFGLSEIDAIKCFAGEGLSQTFYGKPLDDITPTDVARTLLALPYTIPAEGV